MIIRRIALHRQQVDELAQSHPTISPRAPLSVSARAPDRTAMNAVAVRRAPKQTDSRVRSRTASHEVLDADAASTSVMI